jgi:hypothetical protein
MDLDVNRRLEEAHEAHRTGCDGVAEEAGHELLGERHLGLLGLL